MTEVVFDNSASGFKDPTDKYVHVAKKGLSRELVKEISAMKGEPEWMTETRLKGYEHFIQRPMPDWGANLSTINFQNIHYYMKATEKQGRTWDEVPVDIKRTFERLGIPEAERKFLAGVG